MVAFRQQRQPEQQKKQQQIQQQKQQQMRGDASARRKESLSHAATTREATHDSASSSPATGATAAAAAGAGCEGLEGNLHWTPFEFSCGDFDASSPYVPVALLGRGAVGRVFRCTERSSGDSVAVKVVSKHLLWSRSLLRHWVLKEKKALMALSLEESIRAPEYCSFTADVSEKRQPVLGSALRMGDAAGRAAQAQLLRPQFACGR